MQTQVLREMNFQPDQALVIRIDVDRSPDTARYYDIESIPTLLAFRDGELQHRQVGLADAEEIHDMLGL